MRIAWLAALVLFLAGGCGPTVEEEIMARIAVQKEIVEQRQADYADSVATYLEFTTLRPDGQAPEQKAIAEADREALEAAERELRLLQASLAGG